MGKPNQPLDLPHNRAIKPRTGRRMRWHLFVYTTLVAIVLVAWLPTLTTPAPAALSTDSPSIIGALVSAPSAAAQSTSPGGVATNLAWWFQGNAGVQTSGTDVTGWNDMVGTLNTTQATAGNQPSYTRYQNFNPVVTFDGATDFLRNTAGYWKTTTNNQQYNVFAVSTAQNTGNHSLFGENTNNGVQTFWAPGNSTVSNGLYSSYISTASWGGVVGTPNLWTGRYNNSSSPKVNAIQRDGRQIASNTTTVAFNGANAAFYLGIYDGSNYRFQGDIAELIMYNRDLTAAERNQVESYLAIKWGITLMGTQAITYTDSTGAVVWNATANSAYHNDVAGIGRDDNAGLNQKQSRSINSDDLVTIGLGAIATTNISNASTFTNDRSFLIWGNNNGVIRYLDPYTNTTGINTRLDRVWKVAKTGNISNVEFCAPATTQASHLLVNATDPTFGSGTTEITLTAKTVAGTASLCASNQTFNNGVYFTLARFVQAPVGIVSNIAWWFRGDVGVQTNGDAVTDWQDSAIGWADGTDLPSVTQPAPNNQPSYTEYQNFNPMVSFDGSSDYLRNNAGFWKNSTNNQQYNTFMVSINRTVDAAPHPAFFEYTPQGHQTLFLPNQGSVSSGLWSSYAASTSNVGTVGTPYLWTGRYKHDATAANRVNSIARDGKVLTANQNTIAFNGGASSLDIGAYGGNWYYNGDIAEILMYDRDLSAAERNKVESYLAIKWGISLDQNTATNYVASDGTIIWDATANVSYTHDIAGIGVDALAELNQKQSRSVNSDDLVTIGLGTIATTNISNTSTFAADRSFLLWGNNNSANRYLYPYSGSGVVNTRLARVWKVDTTKAVSNVEFCVPATTQATRLLVNATDPTFISTTTEISLTTKTAADQVSLCASGLTFNDGVYFTLARYSQAPGSVVTNLAWWFRGDVGVQTNGDAVTDWQDSAIGWADGTDLPSVTQPAPNNQPSYTEYQNFNPMVSFDGSSDYLRNNAGFWKNSTNNQQYNTFMVSINRTADAAPHPAFLEYTPQGHQTLFLPNQGSVSSGLWSSYAASTSNVGTVGTPYLWTGRYKHDATAANRVNSIARDGKVLTANQSTVAFNGGASPLDIGAYGGNWYYNGDIAEILMYDRDLSAAERNKVESYLAIKYGITLLSTQPISYTNSAGTVIWNATTNSAYHNDIAGIGRDDSSGLYQKQSASLNSDNLVTIGLGAIATNNLSNNRTFANDRAFLVWGNNNAVMTFDTPIVGTELRTMPRIWKVSETGTGANPIGSVKVRIPSATFVGANPKIVRSTDITFTTSDTFVPLVDDGNGNMEAVIDFANGDYFTLAQEPPPAPGAVNNNLAWWFRGDWGVQTTGVAVTQWNDGTGVLNVSQATINNQPTYTKYQNFNRIVTFDGSNDYLRNTGGYWKSTTNNQQYNTFIVSINRNAGGLNAAFGENTSVGYQIMFLPYSGNAYNGFWGSYLSNSNQIGTVGTPYLWGGRFNNSSSPKINAIRRNGVQLASSASTVAFGGSSSPLDIGASVPNGWYYNGDIAEVALYARDLTTIERQRVESYLALKWGINLGGAKAISYTNSAGTVIWNATTDSAYSYRVAGIGFDKYTALDQRISRSNGAGSVVTIATTDDFTSPNLDNSRTALSNNSYLLWGDNNQDATTWVTNTVASGYPSGKARLTREWLVRTTGSLPPVNIGVQVNDSNLDLPEVYGVLYLIVDRDGDGSFSDEAAQRMTARGNGLYTIANVTLGNGMRFTFGTAAGGIRGEVFQDNDTDGLRDANEPGLADVTITAIDAAGTTTTTVTDLEGKYIFLNSGLQGNTRVTFDLPSDNAALVSTADVSALDNLTSTILGSNSRTSVQFIYVGDGWTVATAGFTAKDRPSPCTNPTVATVCYENGAGSNLPGWLSFGFKTGPNLYRTEASSRQMGAVWGNAYNILSGQLYTAALLKRHVGLGPLAAYNGTDTYTVDGVYVLQYNNGVGVFNANSPGFKLQGVSGVDLGTVRRQPDTNGRLDNDYELMATGVSKDVDTFNKAGRVGFGNADFYAGKLWLINANQRALIQVNVAGITPNGTAAPAANVTQYAITNPGCSNGDFRPWAITFYNGLGYVGVVCSAETSQLRTDLHAYILSFAPNDVGAGYTSVLDFSLDYVREPSTWGGLAGWYPWTRTSADVKDWMSYPQPILSDIDFTAAGDIIIGFMDRWGLQNTVNDPHPVTGAQRTAETSGDLMRACATGSNTWVIEGDTGCTGYTEVAGLNKNTNDGPFSQGEFFDDDTHMQCHGGNLHYENLTGSSCVIGNTVLATKYGSFSEGGTIYTAGLVLFNATSGATQNIYVMPSSLPCTSNDYTSLNNALGEVACICPALPVEIGNRVWNDYNHNGRQDPGEPAIAGLLVELVNSSGSVIGSAVTDGRGEYYFSSAPGTSTSSAKYGLSIPGTGVVVRIPNASGGSQQTPLAGLALTVANQGTDERLDSDATMNGANAIIPVDTIGGRIDHTYDFGFAPNIWDIALRKSVPLQYAAPGDNVTFAIEVFNQIGGPMDNIVLIDYVPANLTINDTDWTPSTLTGPGTITRTLNAGDELPVGGLLPGKSVVVNLTTQILNGVANNTVVTNTVEVASATDTNDQPFTDRDSTPDTTLANDRLVDDMIDNTGGDEDDHDVAVIIVTAQTDIYDLALRKTTEATIVSEGDDVPFTIEIFNQGTTAANSIQLVDRYPTGFTLSPNETGWTDQGNGTARRMLISRLEAGASTKVTILLRAGSTMGTLQNYAEIQQDDNDDVDSQPEDDELDGNGDALIDNIISDNGTNDEDDHDVAPVTVRRFDLALRKQLATGEANPTARGADVTFVIDIFNQGSVNAYDIAVVDYLSPTLTLSENDANGWISGDPNQVLNSIPGPLAPGTSARLTITLRISDTAPFGLLSNYAEIARASDTPAGEETADADSTADNGNGNDLLVDDVIDNSNNDEDDHDLASVTIGRFDLALTKVYRADEGLRGSGNNKTDAIIGVGERVTFTLAITNQGTVTAYDIRVTDNSPRGMIIDDSNLAYNILKGWQVENDQRGHYVFAGPLAPGESASIDVIIFAVGPKSPFYPAGGINGLKTVWGEISAASYKRGGPTVIDEDSTPDVDETNDPGGQPNSPADNDVNGNGTGAVGDGVAATDEDDHDPAQVTVIPSFDLAIIKYPLVDAFGGDAIPLVQPGELITYEYQIVNQSLQTAQDITLTEHVPAGLILDDPNWTPSTLVGPGLAERVHNGVNLAANGVYTALVHFRVNPAIAVSTIYTNVIEISGVNGPSNTPVTDMDSIPNRAGATQKVVIDNMLTGNYLSDPELFDEDDNDIAVLAAEIEDWGDNPDAGIGHGALDYSTTITDNGARHLVIDGLHLGALVDGETDGFPTNGAFGDDTDNLGDEDGVNVNDLIMIIGANATIRVRATNTISSPAYLYGFVDFNANGLFTDTGEVISVTVPMNSVDDEFTLNFGTVPNNGVTSSYARFRLSTADDLSAVGEALDGEVEDYPVFMTANVVDLALRKVRTGAATIQPGSDVTFTITVINQGAVTATNIVVADYLPTDFTVSANDNNGWHSGPTGIVSKTLTASLTPSGTVNASTTTAIVLTAGATTTGTYTNTAEIAAVTDVNGVPAADIDSIADATNGNGGGETTAMENDQVTENGKLVGQDEDDHDPATVTVDLSAANLQLTKQATPSVSKAGDSVIYTLTLFNEGPSDATNVVVEDGLPIGVTYVSHAPAAAATYNNSTRTISWTVATLPANSSTTLTITVVVD